VSLELAGNEMCREKYMEYQESEVSFSCLGRVDNEGSV